MIRFFLLNAFIGIHTILFSIWGVMVSIFDKSGRWVHIYCARPWAKVILQVCGVKVHVTGLKHIKGDIPRIYLSNHQSFFDIFTLLAYLPVHFKFILKQELMKIPFLGIAMRRAGYIGIERGDPRRAIKSLQTAAERIKGGASVLIFPEGTRSTDGRIQPFKKGGFHLAIKAGCHLVPMAIIGSRDIVPKGSLRIRKGMIGMSIGKPISLESFSKKNLPQLMDQMRTAMIEQYQNGVRELKEQNIHTSGDSSSK